jgi:lipopolysaccharide transport system permease protein
MEPTRRLTSTSPVQRIQPPTRWFEFRLAELWKYRELLYFFVLRDVKIRYKQTVLGIAWVVVQPLLTMLTFTIFFGRLAKIPSQGLPYPVFYLAAVVPWAYFSNALLGVTNIVVENQRVITKVYFPRLVLPLSAALSGLVDFCIGFILLVVFTLSYGMRPSLSVLLLPLFLLLIVFTVLGVGLWLSALNALYRDVRYLIPFLVQFWMLASPVAYPSSLVPERWRWVYGLNPMVGVIEGFRWALTGKVHSPGSALHASIAIVCFSVFGGLLFFNRMEGTIADRV